MARVCCNFQTGGDEAKNAFKAIRLEAIASSNKKLLGAPGIATRSKDATWGSWPYY